MQGSLSYLYAGPPQELIMANHFGIVATDYQEGTLKNDVSRALGVAYMSEAEQPYVPEVRPALVAGSAATVLHCWSSEGRYHCWVVW